MDDVNNDPLRYARESWATRANGRDHHHNPPEIRAASESSSKSQPADDRSLVVRCASDIDPEPIDWIWFGRLAVGKHTCFGGEPGVGKSQLSIAIIAAVTTGGDWPCDEGTAPIGNVVILSAEDGAADTVVPRLIAAGAERSRVHIVSAVVRTNGRGRRSFNLQSDLDLLEAKIESIGDVKLVIIDPISSYMGKANGSDNIEVRGVLEPLSELADRLRVAVMSITHFSKTSASNSQTKALHKFIQSIAFVAAPRAAFAVMADPDNEERRLVLLAKTNISARPKGLAYFLEGLLIENETILTSRVLWAPEHVDITADQVMADANDHTGRGGIAEAEDFLRQELSNGPQPALEMIDKAEALGISKRTLRRARKKVGVHADKAGFDEGWIWKLTFEPSQGGQ